MIKKVLISLILVLFMVIPAFADINLDVPKEMSKDAVKVMVYSFTITPSHITVNLNWYAADDSIVKQETIRIIDRKNVITFESCSDIQYTNQIDCETNTGIWTDTEIVNYRDFSDINTKPLYAIMQKTIKRMLNLKGTED